MLKSVTCAHCGERCQRLARDINRARAAGRRIFCDRECAALGRRKHKTKAQLVEEKRLYDAAYRVRNRAMLKAKKAAYHKRTYDPVEAAIMRKRNMPRHVAYCQRPEYRRWKSTYDRQYKAKKFYGPFAEAAMLTTDLNREIKGRKSKHDIRYENKTTNKAQFRKREEAAERERSRPRHRYSRRNHSVAVG